MNIIDTPAFKSMLGWWKSKQYASIAFAGTGRGMLPNQKRSLQAILACVANEIPDRHFHHGNWVGADEEAHQLAMPAFKVHVHHPSVVKP